MKAIGERSDKVQGKRREKNQTSDGEIYMYAKERDEEKKETIYMCKQKYVDAIFKPANPFLMYGSGKRK